MPRNQCWINHHFLSLSFSIDRLSEGLTYEHADIFLSKLLMKATKLLQPRKLLARAGQ